MEPITAAAIASLFFTTYLEKTGEILGKKASESYKKLFTAMKQNYPDVIEKELQGQLSYSETLTQIETAVERNPEIAEAVINFGEAVKSEPNQEMLLQVLANVVNINLEKEHSKSQSNFTNDNLWVETSSVNHQGVNMRQQPLKKHNSSMIIGFYFSILSLVLIGLLVFVPLSVGIQQVLIALIALFVAFSMSAFKRHTRYTVS